MRVLTYTQWLTYYGVTDPQPFHEDLYMKYVQQCAEHYGTAPSSGPVYKFLRGLALTVEGRRDVPPGEQLVTQTSAEELQAWYEK